MQSYRSAGGVTGLAVKPHRGANYKRRRRAGFAANNAETAVASEKFCTLAPYHDDNPSKIDYQCAAIPRPGT
jgi:hypothetical protein